MAAELLGGKDELVRFAGAGVASILGTFVLIVSQRAPSLRRRPVSESTTFFFRFSRAAKKKRAVPNQEQEMSGEPLWGRRKCCLAFTTQVQVPP